MNKLLKKLAIYSTSLILAIITQVSVMIKGWGLEPQSWWWIIFVHTIGYIFVRILIEKGNEL